MDNLSASRRRVLRLLSLSAGSALAGCNTNSAPATESTPTTVVFTDSTAPTRSPTASSETPTATAANPIPTQSSPSPTADEDAPPTPTETQSPTPPSDQVFDGGDLASFVDAIQTVSERGGGTVTVDPGTYRFDQGAADSGPSSPDTRLENIQNVTIEGNGATLLFTRPSRGGLRFVTGSDITIRDLTLDYDPVPFTQGEVVDFSTDDRTITLALDDGFPTLSHEMFQKADNVYATTHAADGAFVRGTRAHGHPDKFFSSVRSTEDGRYVLTLARRSHMTGVEVGRRLTIVARNNDSVLSFYKVDTPSVENVTIRTSNGAAFAAQVCAAPTFENCTIAPPPESSRQLASVADGIRITNCLPGTTIENCRHEQVGDDSITVDHRLNTVLEIVDDRTIRVKNLHPFVAKSGDVMEVISPAGVLKGTLPPVANITPQFPPVGDRGKPETITFEQPIRERLSTGDFIGNQATASRDYTIRGCELRDHRGNLIRVSAGHGVIEENVLAGAHQTGIELHTYSKGNWPPKGRIVDVTVRNNHISRPGLNYLAGLQTAGIYLHHDPPADVTTEGRPNENIAIVDNEIETCASVGMEINGTAGLQLEGNTMRDLHHLDYPNKGLGLTLTNVADATLSGNTVVGSSDRLQAFGARDACEDISLSENTLRIDGDPSPAELVEQDQ